MTDIKGQLYKHMKQIKNNEWRKMLKSFMDGGQCHAVRGNAIPALDDFCKEGRKTYAFPVNIVDDSQGTKIERGRKAHVVYTADLMRFCSIHGVSIGLLEGMMIAMPYTYEIISEERNRRKQIRKDKPEERKIKLDKWADEVLKNGKVCVTKYEDELYNSCLSVSGYNVERQHKVLVGGKVYILDFYIPECKAAIEVDGGYHKEEQQKKYDARRKRKIYRVHGIATYRISNDKVADPKEQERLLEWLRKAFKA
jgi:very-short-patch-repair endonuclease